MQQIEHALYFLFILIGLIICCVAFENNYWRSRDKTKCGTLVELGTNAILGFSYKLIDAIALFVYVFVLYDWVKEFGLELSFFDGESGDLGWQIFGICLLYIIVDFCFYITHFCMHKIRWFWASHVTHHSSNRYNFTVALRQNFTVVLNGALLIWWLPLALLGFEKNAVLLAMEINLLFQFLLHTEVPTKFNKLGWVFNTPDLHRVHHGCNEKQIDSNFGGTFIVWDRLFNTYQSPETAGELHFGLTSRPPVNNKPWTLLFHEWQHLFADFRQSKSLLVFLKEPNWLVKQQKSD